jgi:hypothetical protein
MAKPVVTASDLHRAMRLKSILAKRGASTKELASLLAEIREEIILCASVRLEREYGLVQRALPLKGAKS